MAYRQIQKDKNGLLIKFNKAVFRPSGQSAAQLGQTVWVDRRSMMPSEIRFLVGPGFEKWTSPTPMTPSKRMKVVQPQGQQRITKLLGGANVSVILSDNGKLKVNGRWRSGDIYFALNSGMALTIDEWRALTKEIDEAIEEVAVTKVTSALKEDVEVAEEIAKIAALYEE